MVKPIIVLKMEDWTTVYFEGKKWSEGYNVLERDWLILGMLAEKKGLEISDIKFVFINVNDVSDEEMLWNLPERIENLDDEIKEIIKRNIINKRRN